VTYSSGAHSTRGRDTRTALVKQQLVYNGSVLQSGGADLLLTSLGEEESGSLVYAREVLMRQFRDIYSAYGAFGASATGQCACVCVCVFVFVRASVRECACVCVLSQSACVRVCVRVRGCVGLCVRTGQWACLCVCVTFTHKPTRTNVRAYTHMHTRIHSHIHTHLHSHTHSHTHSHAHALTHTCTRTRTHTHMHTYMEAEEWRLSPSRFYRTMLQLGANESSLVKVSCTFFSGQRQRV